MHDYTFFYGDTSSSFILQVIMYSMELANARLVHCTYSV